MNDFPALTAVVCHHRSIVSHDVCDLSIVLTDPADGSMSDTLILEPVDLEDAPLDGPNHVTVAIESAEKALTVAGYTRGGSWCHELPDYSTVTVTLDRYRMGHEWGWLCDYDSKEPLREATEAEYGASAAAGPTGAFAYGPRIVFVDVDPR